MVIYYKPIFSLLLIVGSFWSISGQGIPTRISEAEIKFEELYIEGLAKKTSGDAEGALKIFEDLLEQDRRNDAILYEVARIQKVLDREQDALESINRAIRLNPDEVWYYLFKAGVQEQSSNFKGAAETYNKIIELDPYESRHVFRQSEHYVRIKDSDKAIETLTTLEQRIGPFEGIYQRRYDIYKSIGDQQSARQEIEKLVSLHPSDTEYLYLLAGEFVQEGQLDRADSLLNRILEIDPTDTRASMALAGRKKSDSSPAEYILSLEHVFLEPTAEIDPKIIEIIPYVEQLSQSEDSTLTRALLTAISWLEVAHPNEAKVKAIKGDVYQLSNNFDNAIDAYIEAVKYEKGVYSVWEQLLYLLKREARYEELYTYSEDALDVFPNQVKLWLSNAYGLRKINKYESALEALEQAEFMTFDNVAVQQEIKAQKAAILFEDGQKDKSLALFDEAIEELPGNYVLQCIKALFLVKDGRHEEAIQSIQTLSESDLGKEIATATIAVSLYDMDKKEEARSAIENILMISGQAEVFEYLIQLMDQRTKSDQLLNFWQDFLENIVLSS